MVAIKKKFPYNLENLTWDNEHNRNMEEKYCYCGKGIKEDQPMIRCDKCKQLFHRDCVHGLVKPLLFGDTFGVFNCSVCNQGPETFERKGLSWISIVHLVIYNLIKNAQIEDAKKPKKDKREHYYFRWKEDVCAFIDEYWDYLIPDKQRSATWNNTIASVLSTHSNIFLSGLEKFHQSAWWTLHKYEPPTGEKKAKATKVKPNLKKPLKRAREAEPKPKKAKKVKVEKVELDLLDFSSLSELSSSHESDTEEKRVTRSKSDTKKKKPRRRSSAVDVKKEVPQEVTPPPPRREPTPPPPPPSPPSIPATIEKEKKITRSISPSASPSITATPVVEQVIPKSSTPQLSRHTSISSTPPSSTPNITHVSLSTIPAPSVKHTSTPASNTNPTLSPQEEWHLLQKLEHSSKKLSPAANRYKRKLAVRRLKRSLGIKSFDLDSQLAHLLKMPNHTLSPISKDTTIQAASNQQVEQVSDDQQHLLDKITYTPYTSSFASRLYGSIRQRHTITRDEPWLSSWNGRKLRPFIRRDFESKPRRMLLLGQIKQCQGKPVQKGSPQPDGIVEGESIDYVYFQKEHLAQVNLLLCRSFWEGVDVSESLLFPEFSIVALYKRHVIGCAFMTPEAYITYFAVDPGWTNAGIGQFMLYHLFQTAISKDITLHVSANNNAMILYQKFGFKPEEFIVNFYDKYLPPDSVFSKNAFFLRLRR